MTIKIEIPSGAEFKTLAAAIGKALYQYGSSADINGVLSETTTEPLSVGANGDSSESRVETVTFKEPQTDVTSEQYDQLAQDGSQPSDEVDEGLPTVDGEGLPHDKRINSDPATIIANGNWKARRQPKTMNKEEWLIYINGVKAELRQALSGEPIVEEEQQAEVIAPPVVTDEVETIAPPVVEEEPQAEVIAPPAATDDVELPERTFAELMKFITSNNGKVTLDMVNKLINAHGVKSLPLLNTARPDLIKVVYAELEKEVNNG